MNLALFDFDGTITSGDSFLGFLLFSKSKLSLFWGGIVLSPVLFSYKLGILDNGKAKEIAISWFFKGVHENELQQLSNRFAREKLPGMVRTEAAKRISWHIENKDRVIFISASIENYLQPFCNQLGVELVCTQLQFSEEGLFTGKFASENCYGPEKIKRLEMLLNPSDYNEIYAYGDSKGDREMLAIATQSHYKPFR